MHVEYMGFSTEGMTREYRLRIQNAGVVHDFVRAIPLEAFVSHRARYQDAPEICFLNLQRDLADTERAMPEAYLSISDAELEQYRTAHSPRPPQRKPKPPLTPR